MIVSRAALILLEVVLHEDCAVDVNAAGPRTLPAGTSGITLALREGLNDVAIEIADLGGNVGEPVRFLVLVDTLRPALELGSVERVNTNDPDFIVNGSTEPGCQVTVDGISVGLRADNSFSTVVRLDKGTNYIQISSVDVAGNKAFGTIVVELEVVGAGEGPSGGMALGVMMGIGLGLCIALVAFALFSRRRSATAGVAGPRSPEALSSVPVAGPERAGDAELDRYAQGSVVRRRER